MGEFNPFVLDEFGWDVLKCYIKHEYGNFKMYNTTFFSNNLSDETAMLTLEEFYNKAIDYDGNLWKDKEPFHMRIKDILRSEEDNPIYTVQIAEDVFVNVMLDRSTNDFRLLMHNNDKYRFSTYNSKGESFYYKFSVYDVIKYIIDNVYEVNKLVKEDPKYDSVADRMLNPNMVEIGKDKDGHPIYEIKVSEIYSLYMRKNEYDFTMLYYKENGIITKVPGNLQVSAEEFERYIRGD